MNGNGNGNHAPQRFIVLVPLTDLRDMSDVTEAIRAREAGLAAKVAAGAATPEDIAALAAVRRLLEEGGASTGRPPAQEPSMLLRVPEVARHLGLSASTVREMLARGEIPSVRIGSSVRVRRDQLAAWVAGLGDQ